jgi:phosphopantetheinyl transferase (holo-ACP synthase)
MESRNDPSLVAAYLSKLLNLPIDKSSRVRLSSAQRIRLFNWLKSSNYQFDVGLLNAEFSVEMLCESTRLAEGGPASSGEAESGEIKDFDLHPSAIGIDIQSVSELFPAGLSSDPKSDLDLLEIFTLKELSYAQSKLSPQDTLTGIFAAKEAIIKCGKNFERLTDIEILPNEAGMPASPGFAISISHSRDFAVAVATHSGNTVIKEGYSSAKNLDSDINIEKVERFGLGGILLLTCIVIAVFFLIGRYLLYCTP